MHFRDRTDAGSRLSELLLPLSADHPVILALPRGGVPVAAEIARALNAPLDVVVVRKLGVPWEPEIAMGAIGEGVRVLDPAVVRALGVDDEQLAEVEERERHELTRRERRYRGDGHGLSVEGQVAIIVDDGLATGATAAAACRIVRAAGAKHIVLAVPVAPGPRNAGLAYDADEFVCLHRPPAFQAIGQWYTDFGQTSDAEVARLLHGSGAGGT